jgi:hypothetical protein
MSKAGPSWLSDQLYCSANTARQIDPELARIYHVQMVERGAHHTKALCVVAAHLAERAWVTLERGVPYVLRDLDGNVITVAEGKAIVTEHLKVTEETRRRRRTKKWAGKAPQGVLSARAHKPHPKGWTAEATFPVVSASTSHEQSSSVNTDRQANRLKVEYIESHNLGPPIIPMLRSGASIEPASGGARSEPPGIIRGIGSRLLPSE